MDKSRPILAPPAPEADERPHVRGLLAALWPRFEQGVWAVPLALAPAFLVAAIASVPTPLEPLAEAIMQRTPVSLVGTLLALLGALSRTFALLGAIAVTLPIGGAIAVIAPPTQAPDTDEIRRSGAVPRWFATAALALLAVQPLIRAAPYPAQAASALVAACCFVPAILIVRRVQSRQHSHRNQSAQRGTTTRRAFMRRAALHGAQLAGFVALASFDLWSGALNIALGRADTLRRLFAYTPPTARSAGFPVPGLAPEVTPVSRFYLLSKNDVDPAIAPEDWILRIDGAVDHPLTLSYEQLLALPRTDQYVTLRCVSNPPNGPLMSNAYWSGVSLSTLLRRASVNPAAVAVEITAPDAYAEVAPLSAALDSAALLAYGMNGETLPRSHGGPVRLVLPGYFGFKNVKWVERITVTRTVPPSYWSDRGWTAALVHSIARIDLATPIDTGLLVAGFAFTGARGVSAVQVRADDGPWQYAGLNVPALSPYTWVQWRMTLPLAHGSHALTARVIDGSGQPQEPATANVYPNGATGLDTIHVSL